MKKANFLCLLVLLLTAGCASSDRMVRMSGGVFDEYKAPPSYRVRSERFQQKSADLSASNKNRQSKIGDFDSPLVIDISLVFWYHYRAPPWKCVESGGCR